jgi:ABC-type bacteriocin/lantibiotic exporter with double-glycine peptidase domain
MTSTSTSIPRRRAGHIAGALVALAFFGASCASMATTKLHADQISPSATVLELPIVRQDAMYECGLVAVSSLCSYYGVDLTPEQTAGLAERAAQENGLSGGELRGVLEAHDMEVFVFQGTLDDGMLGLRHHVNNGRPLLVMTARDGLRHYCLFIGYDEQLHNVVLLDPRRGRVVLPNAVFENAWNDAERFTLLAVPRSEPSDSILSTAAKRTSP